MTDTPDFRNRARSVREAARQQLMALRSARLGQKGRTRGLLAPGPQPAHEMDPPDLPELAVDTAPENAEAEPADEVAADVEGVPVPLQDAPPDTVAECPVISEDLPVDPAPPKPRKPARTAKKAKAAVPPPSAPARERPATRPAPKETAEDQLIRRAAIAEMEAPQPQVFQATRDVAPPASEAPGDAPAVSDGAAAGSSSGPDMALEAAASAAVPSGEHPMEAATTSEFARPEAGPAPEAAGEIGLKDLPGAGPGLVWLLGRCGIQNLTDLAAADPKALGSQMGLVGNILDVSLWTDHARRLLQTGPS